MSNDQVGEAVADAYRREWGRIAGALIRLTGDWDLAEECVQDAFTRALETWSQNGIPGKPGAWLATTARNRAMDRLRRQGVEAVKLQQLARLDAAIPGQEVLSVPDDPLALMFTCCHPALSRASQVALTLRYLAGLTTKEIARAFLVPEKTMAMRLTRAKSKVANAGIPFRVPPAHLLTERLQPVLAVLYLLFNEGYAATAGDELIRERLCDEAIGLARSLTELMPDEPEALGLLALMLLHDSRRNSRTDPAGDLIPLDEQDRNSWNRAAIDDGLSLLHKALRCSQPGAYQIQAAIAGCHAAAPTSAVTDWPQIAGLYAELQKITPNPIVELNRIVAVGMAQGAAAAMPLLDQLTRSGALAGHHLLAATRADLLRRTGNRPSAADAYREALALAPTEPERRFFQRRLDETTTHRPDPGAGSEPPDSADRW